jgi:hypothetical protein
MKKGLALIDISKHLTLLAHLAAVMPEDEDSKLSMGRMIQTLSNDVHRIGIKLMK